MSINIKLTTKKGYVYAGNVNYSKAYDNKRKLTLLSDTESVVMLVNGYR